MYYTYTVYFEILQCLCLVGTFFGNWLGHHASGSANQGIITARSRAFLRTMHPRSPTSLPSWATRTDLWPGFHHGLPCIIFHLFQAGMTHIVREVDRPGSKLNKKESLVQHHICRTFLCENSVVKGSKVVVFAPCRTLPDLSELFVVDSHQLFGGEDLKLQGCQASTKASCGTRLNSQSASETTLIVDSLVQVSHACTR